jgi:hypothetical protein
MGAFSLTTLQISWPSAFVIAYLQYTTQHVRTGQVRYGHRHRAVQCSAGQGSAGQGIIANVIFIMQAEIKSVREI